ncbi:hypothetical protein [Spartinivicinus ruber]|uniref:hypothetical protein n=1 Tax=Spartinivicinus ruber TaxID=2683272 RepID=UPI0013D886B3|nr:hypothetical protein [Spartinivicinus ruber]
MLTILKRSRANGSAAYRAVVRVKRKGKIVYSESRTFDCEKLAKLWGRKRELELQTPEGIQKLKVAKVTIEQLIDRYIKEVEPITASAIDAARAVLNQLGLIGKSSRRD